MICDAKNCEIEADEVVRVEGDFGLVYGRFCFGHATLLCGLLNPTISQIALLKPVVMGDILETN